MYSWAYRHKLKNSDRVIDFVLCRIVLAFCKRVDIAFLLLSFFFLKMDSLSHRRSQQVEREKERKKEKVTEPTDGSGIEIKGPNEKR